MSRSSIAFFIFWSSLCVYANKDIAEFWNVRMAIVTSLVERTGCGGAVMVMVGL